MRSSVLQRRAYSVQREVPLIAKSHTIHLEREISPGYQGRVALRYQDNRPRWIFASLPRLPLDSNRDQRPKGVPRIQSIWYFLLGPRIAGRWNPFRFFTGSLDHWLTGNRSPMTVASLSSLLPARKGGSPSSSVDGRSGISGIGMSADARDFDRIRSSRSPRPDDGRRQINDHQTS